MPVWPVERIPLESGWPGWWSKLEALRGDRLTGWVVLMDLDTLPVGDLSDLARWRGEFALIRDVNPRVRRRNSGLMAFRSGPGTHAARLHDVFQADSRRWIRDFKMHGDGGWLDAHAGDTELLQDILPGQIVSSKLDARSGPPDGARLVLGHGRPRFSDPAAGWAHREWTRRAA